MGAPNDTTKFSLAFLILWIIITVILAVLSFLRVLKFPRLLSALPNLIVAVLQLAVFALFLAALADDTWSKSSSGSLGYGVAGTHKADEPGKDFNNYRDSACSGSDDLENMCNTYITTGAFILIFGIPSVIFSLILTAQLLMGAMGKSLSLLSSSVLAALQLVLMQACTLLWAVSAHTVFVEAKSNVDLATSWILCIVATILSLVVALGVEPAKQAAVGSGAQ